MIRAYEREMFMDYVTVLMYYPHMQLGKCFTSHAQILLDTASDVITAAAETKIVLKASH